jgi:iron complex outermembrane receptor protein
MTAATETSLRLALRVGIMAGTALWAVAAYAQDAPPADTPPAAAPTAPRAGSVDTTGDIIVTATRRNEKLRDVPMSITALSGETLQKQGITSVTDLVRVVPGFEVPVYGNFVQFAIRGISSTGAGLGDSSNIALYVDGVYQASEQSQTIDFPDVADIQVLKGPQGTLYGQNAAGGAVIVNTLAPSFTLKGKITAAYGNFNDKEVRGYITGPISDKIALLVSGSWQDRDGFRKDLLRGGHDAGLRSNMIKAKVLIQPSSDASITLAGFYREHDDSNSIAGFVLNSNSIGNGLDDIYQLHLPRAGKNSFAMDYRPDAHLKNWGFSITGKFNIGLGTINTSSAFYKTAYHSFQDPDFTPVEYGQVDLPIKGQVFVQEVNFVSNPIGPVTLTGGLFYMHRKESYTPQLFNATYFGGMPTVYPQIPTIFAVIGGRSDTSKNSYAAYLEGDWKVTDHLTLEVGGRYSTETQKYATEKLTPAVPYQDLTHSPVKFSKFTPHAVIRYKFDDGTNIYASWSNGFKSGFLDATNVSAKPVKPETVQAFEIGYKGRPLPGVSLNLAGFHYNYKNIQVFHYDPTCQSGCSGYENAAAAQIDGVDAETTIKLNQHLTFFAGVSWLIKAKYQKYLKASDLAPIYVRDVYPNVVLVNPNDTLGNANVVIPDAKGLWLIRAPKVQVSASLSYQGHIGGGDLDALIAAHYNSGFKYDPLGYVRQKAYTTVDAEVGYSPDGLKGLRIAGWVRNLTNTYYLSSELNSTVGNTAAYAAPRTFGGKLEYAF